MIPSSEEVAILTDRLTTGNLTLKLYGNNVTPTKSNITSDFTEIAGGGYAAKTLLTNGWTITPGTGGVATIASYAFQDFIFTSAISAPSTIYGYFIVDGSNNLRGAVRFAESFIPFTPTINSKIRITPKINLN